MTLFHSLYALPATFPPVGTLVKVTGSNGLFRKNTANQGELFVPLPFSSLPPMSIHDYLDRLASHAALTPAMLLSTVYYMDRLSAQYPGFSMSSLTAHRFLVAAATVAAKCSLSDRWCTTEHYARVGGISPAELCLLQRELLSRLQWRVVASQQLLEDYYHALVDRSSTFELAPAVQARLTTRALHSQVGL